MMFHDPPDATSLEVGIEGGEDDKTTGWTDGAVRLFFARSRMAPKPSPRRTVDFVSETSGRGGVRKVEVCRRWSVPEREAEIRGGRGVARKGCRMMVASIAGIRGQCSALLRRKNVDGAGRALNV